MYNFSSQLTQLYKWNKYFWKNEFCVQVMCTPRPAGLNPVACESFQTSLTCAALRYEWQISFSDLAKLVRIFKFGKLVWCVTWFVHSAWANIIRWKEWQKDGFVRSAIPLTPSGFKPVPMIIISRVFKSWFHRKIFRVFLKIRWRMNRADTYSRSLSK